MNNINKINSLSDGAENIETDGIVENKSAEYDYINQKLLRMMEQTREMIRDVSV
jgi:hypothetical protein